MNLLFKAGRRLVWKKCRAVMRGRCVRRGDHPESLFLLASCRRCTWVKFLLWGFGSGDSGRERGDFVNIACKYKI